MKSGMYCVGFLFFMALLLLGSSLYLKSQMEITRQVLKKDNFKLTNQVYEFRVVVPRSTQFNVVLRFQKRPDVSLLSLIKYEINTEVSVNGNLIEKNVIDQGTSGIRRSATNDVISWYLLGWKADKNLQYDLTISFKSNDERFDKLNKEILIESAYDPAALPFLSLLQFVNKVLFVATAVMGIVALLFLKTKRKSKDRVRSTDLTK